MKREHIEKLMNIVSKVVEIHKEVREFDLELGNNLEDYIKQDSNYGDLFVYVANADIALESLIDDLMDVRRMLHN